MSHILVGRGCVLVCTVETPTLYPFSILADLRNKRKTKPPALSQTYEPCALGNRPSLIDGLRV